MKNKSTIEEIRSLVEQQKKSYFVNENYLLTHTPNLQGDKLDENLFLNLRKGMRALGSWQAGTGLVGKFNKKGIERSAKIRSDLEKRLEKLSNDAVQEFIKWHEKEYPDFPAEDDVEKFFEGAVAITNFYDGLAQQVKKYNDWYDTASKEEIIGGEMPPEEGLKPEIANELVKAIDEWVASIIDTKMTGYDKRALKEEEEEKSSEEGGREFKGKTLSEKSFEDLKKERIVSLVGGGLSTIGAAEAVASLLAASAFEGGWPGIQKFITTWSEQAVEQPNPSSQTVDPDAAAGAASDALNLSVSSKGGGALEFIARSAEAIMLSDGVTMDLIPQDDFVENVNTVSEALNKTPAETIEFLFVEGGAGNANFDADLLSMGYEYVSEDPTNRNIGELVTSGNVRDTFMDWLQSNYPTKAGELMQGQAGGAGFTAGAPGLKQTSNTVFGMTKGGVSVDLAIDKIKDGIVDLGPEVVKSVTIGLVTKGTVGLGMAGLGLSVGTLGPALVAAGFVLAAGALTSKLLKKKGLRKYKGKPSLEQGLDGFKGSRMGVLRAVIDNLDLFADVMPVTKTGIKTQLALPKGKTTLALPPAKSNALIKYSPLAMAKYQAGEFEDDEDIIDVQVIPFYRGLLGPGQPDEETPDAPDEETPETPGEELPPVPDEEGEKEKPEKPGKPEKTGYFIVRLDKDGLKPYKGTTDPKMEKVFQDIAALGIIGSKNLAQYGVTGKAIGRYTTDNIAADKQEKSPDGFDGLDVEPVKRVYAKPTDSYDRIVDKVTDKKVQKAIAATRAKNKVVYFVVDAGILTDLAGPKKNKEEPDFQKLGKEIWTLATNQPRFGRRVGQWGALAHNVISKAVKEFSEKKRRLNKKEVIQIYRDVVVRGNNEPKIGALQDNLKEKALNNKVEEKIINAFMNVMAKYGLAEPSAKQLQEFLKRSIAKQYKVMLQEKRLMSKHSITVKKLKTIIAEELTKAEKARKKELEKELDDLKHK